MAAEPVVVDRRQRRRQETIEEVLDVAVEVMAEQGVAGLSVGEVARRMGIRPPSLYVYFPSKNALYDALFHRGARGIVREFADSGAFDARPGVPLEEQLLDAGRFFLRWAIANPVFTQLLFWRPAPGFEPSPEAYAPAVELVELSQTKFAELQSSGLIRDDVSIEDLQRDWSILVAGIVSQQLSNAPHESFDDGAFTSRLPSVVAMFARHYASPSSAPTRRARNARRG